MTNTLEKGRLSALHNKVSPNGTLPYWPAVQYWPPDRPRARRPAGPHTGRRQRYRRRRQTQASKTILAHYAAGQ